MLNMIMIFTFSEDYVDSIEQALTVLSKNLKQEFKKSTLIYIGSS